MSNAWCNGSQVYTRFFDSLSILFPAWERAFAAVAKHHLESTTDPDLRARIKEFINEEMAHASAHDAYNARAGVTDLANAEIAKTQVVHRKPGHKLWLATMVSIENLAVCIGRMYLDRFQTHTGREHGLWAWHSREEIGHKALAIDLWRELGYSDANMRAVARQNQVYVLRFIAAYTLRGFDPKKARNWIDLVSLLWNLTAKVLIPMLAIYRPGFHPNRRNDAKYLELPA